MDSLPTLLLNTKMFTLACLEKNISFGNTSEKKSWSSLSSVPLIMYENASSMPLWMKLGNQLSEVVVQFCTDIYSYTYIFTLQKMCPYISHRQRGVKPIVSYFKTSSVCAFSATSRKQRNTAKSKNSWMQEVRLGPRSRCPSPTHFVTSRITSDTCSLLCELSRNERVFKNHSQVKRHLFTSGGGEKKLQCKSKCAIMLLKVDSEVPSPVMGNTSNFKVTWLYQKLPEEWAWRWEHYGGLVAIGDWIQDLPGFSSLSLPFKKLQLISSSESKCLRLKVEWCPLVTALIQTRTS